MRRDLHEQNRRSWNEATRAHSSHKRDEAGFLRDGGSTLFPEEIALAGDVRGKRLVHLQCNAGQDTLSFASLGAVATGVDISDTAIDAARALSLASGIPASFERSDIYAWLDETGRSARRFDLAFASYGALPWLDDLGAWARGTSSVLAPGGRLVVVEFHPAAHIFDEQGALRYPYSSHGEPLDDTTGVGDYVAMCDGALSPSGFEAGVASFANEVPCFSFAWGVADIVTAILEAGLAIEALREYPHMNGARFYDGMRELPGRRWAMPEGKPELPLMLGLAAKKLG